MKLTQAIVHRLGRSIVSRLSSSGKTASAYEKALGQQHQYISALEKYGLRIQVLEAVERCPDSTFAEDVAVPPTAQL